MNERADPSKAADRWRLEGRVALVTGGASGIGLACVQALAEAGAIVALSDRDGAAAERAAASLAAAGKRVEAHAMDVADEAAVDAVVAEIGRRHGRLDVLVNNAGTGARQPTESMPLEAWNRVLAINLTGSFLCSRAAGRLMLAAGRGSIVTVASIMGLVGGGLYPNIAYHATKGALVNFTRALAVEWAGRGVRVNAVAPTFAMTPLTRNLLAEPGMRAAIEGLTPLGRLAEAEEVADAVRYLASDAAAMVTGHTLPVDGGWVAR
ncbi:MAG: SDR family oxidoreductase [Proteobacteria bacterium]|nr:SDR family oxidoreductase [Pseudomonadota bacterium]MBI3497486.1 SDR family oxidoreductase [Pseudomonadota bacterium]